MQKLKKISLPSFILKHKLEIILAFGILVRLLLMPITAHPIDMYIWYDMSKTIVANGPFSVTLFPPYNNYFMIIPISHVYNWLSAILAVTPTPISSIPQQLIFSPQLNATVVPDFLFNFLAKLPNLISDIACAIIIYKIVIALKLDHRIAVGASLIWFLNPYLIWISSAWGMWDSVAALFSLLSLYFLIKKKLALSSICLLVGIFVKLYPLLFVVPIGLFFLKDNFHTFTKKEIAKYLAILLVPLLLFFIFSRNSLIEFLGTFLTPNIGPTTNTYASITAFGLTYWSTAGINSILNYSINGNIIVATSIILMTASFTIVIFKTKKILSNNPAELIFPFVLMVFAFFLSYRLVLEQWFIWALPFLVILYTQKRVNKGQFWGLTILALAYSVLNCPLPFFFLPLTPFIGQSLVIAVNAFEAVWGIKIIIQALIGCYFSIIIFTIIVQLSKKKSINSS